MKTYSKNKDGIIKDYMHNTIKGIFSTFSKGAWLYVL